MKRMTQFLAAVLGGRLKSFGDFRTALRKHRLEVVEGPPTGEAFDRFVKPKKVLDVKFDAPMRLSAPEGFFTTDHMLRKAQNCDWQHVDPRLRFFAAKLVETFRRQNIPLYIHCAFRTPAEQQKLVAAGRSRTPPPEAAHVQGCAVDIVHGRYHWEMTRQEWALVGKIGKELADRMGLDVVWGGDWNFYDPAHWELRHWRKNIRSLSVGDPVRLTPRYIVRHLPAPD